MLCPHKHENDQNIELFLRYRVQFFLGYDLDEDDPVTETVIETKEFFTLREKRITEISNRSNDLIKLGWAGTMVFIFAFIVMPLGKLGTLEMFLGLTSYVIVLSAYYFRASQLSITLPKKASIEQGIREMPSIWLIAVDHIFLFSGFFTSIVGGILWIKLDLIEIPPSLFLALLLIVLLEIQFMVMLSPRLLRNELFQQNSNSDRWGSLLASILGLLLIVVIVVTRIYGEDIGDFIFVVIGTLVLILSFAMLGTGVYRLYRDYLLLKRNI